MLRNRIQSAFTLFILMFFLAGCVEVVESVKSGIENAGNFIKAGRAEEEGNTAYNNQDYKKAFSAYQTAAESGGKYGQFMLANMYLTGEGVKKSPKKSLQWMEKSAERGYPPANYLMGRASLPNHPVTAARYFEKAAKKEHGSSMHMLGLMYAGGVGVEQSNTEALRWFRMAKAQGFPVEDKLMTAAGIQSYATKSKRRAAQGQQEKISRQKLVRGIQEELTALGYNPGPVDGLFGGKTRTAIQEFQKKQGTEPDGLATEAILKQLQAAR